MLYSVFRSFQKMLKMTMDDYCSLAGVENEYTLVSNEGYLLSGIEIKGSLNIIGTNLFEDQVYNLYLKLSGILKNKGYKLQFVFARDPESAYRKVKMSVDLARKNAQLNGLDFQSILDEREQLLSQKTSDERCFLIITTTDGVLPPATKKNALKKRNDRATKSNVGLRPGEFSQSQMLAIKEINAQHHSFVDKVYDVFNEFCLIKKLNAYDFLRILRYEIDNDTVSDNWRASLPGDKLPLRIMKDSQYQEDISHIYHPSLSFQLFSEAPAISEDDRTLVKLGQKFISPIMVDIPPQINMPFSELFNSIDEDIPWRFSLTIETGHEEVISKLSTKKAIASLLAFSSSENKFIINAIEDLLSYVEQGEITCACYMNICTWGKSTEIVKQRKSSLIQSMQSWGNCDVIEEFGDSIEAWTNTLPGFNSRIMSAGFPIRLFDCLKMIPFTRTSSPWNVGSLLMRTVDNKLFAYQEGSSLQTKWIDLVFAPPGFGKSVFLAASNTALILNSHQLPRIAIIDIGFSSAAFCSFIKGALADDKKDLVQSYKIEMTEEFAINPFDTPLGCRMPLALDREFLINLTSLLLTPAGDNNGISRLSELCSSLVDAMYDYVSEEKNPHLYEDNVCLEVDAVLKSLGKEIGHDQNVSWWTLVDMLFEKGYVKEAGLAQRFAVPTLKEATSVLAESTNIKDVFGDAKVNGEGLIKFINGMIISAIRDYPILANHSVFDIGHARIVSVDLSSVAQTGSAQADKKTGIMYMLARQLLCREFYRNKKVLPQIPIHYQKYHKENFEKESMTPKKICMDEFHRTKNATQVRNQVVIDIREGRKFDVHISLLSQMLEDFSEDMIELTSNVFILSKGNAEDSVTKIKDKFAPNADSIKALNRYVTGPGKEGSSLLFLSDIKGSSNRVEQVLRLTLGSIEIWAYSTTHEDILLRDKLSEMVGLSLALKLLALEYPGGSAKLFIEEEKNKILKTSENPKEDIKYLYKNVALEIIGRHKDLS